MSQGPTVGHEPDAPGAVGLALLMSDTGAAIAAAAGEIAMLSQVVVSGFGQLPKLLTPPPPIPAPKLPAAAEPPPDAPPPIVSPSVAAPPLASPAVSPPSVVPAPVVPPPAPSSTAPSPTAPSKAIAQPAARPPAYEPARIPAPQRPVPTAPVSVSAAVQPGPLPAALPASVLPALQQAAVPTGAAPALRSQALPASVAPNRPAPSVGAMQQAATPVDYAAFAPLPPAPETLPQPPGAASSELPNAAAFPTASSPSIFAQPALAHTAPHVPANAGEGAAAMARAVSPSLAPPARRPEAGGSPAQGGGGPTHGDVFLDGARVGRWMSDTLARAVSGPSSGSTAFDPQMSAAWPGALQGH